jgi:transcription initiation factor TFIID TATA-box-binding protein
MTDPKAAALIFGSGKVVCTGANSPVNAKIAIDKVIKGLHEIGVKAPKKVRMRIENIVARAKINENLNLNQIAFSLKNVEYEPEQFPGLVYRMKDPKVAFLLFGSGKVVCTGARKIKDVKIAVEKLEKKLRKAGVIK